MSEKVNKGDFIELEYNGRFNDGKLFDTTDQELAKKNDIFSAQIKYGPSIICVGEKQLVAGLDEALVGKEIGKNYVVELSPEQAFGKKDFKKIVLIPFSEFQKKKLNPQPGLQIDMDGEVGTIIKSSGGRVMVNFNHPFAGREVNYEVKINKRIDDQAMQISSFLELTLNFPKIKAEVKEGKAEITLPVELPEQLLKPLSEKLKGLVKLEIVFIAERNTPKQ
ncbi:MAG: peptidylprolyl isomerase [Candidatus Woesearchaeota archaeon]